MYTVWGLPQDEFEQLLRAGKKTAVRWERDVIPPSNAMDELIWLAGGEERGRDTVRTPGPSSESVSSNGSRRGCVSPL